MTRLLLLCSLAWCSAALATEVETDARPVVAQGDEANAVSLRLGGGLTVGLIGLGVVAPVEATLSYEHAFGHLSLTAGVSAAAYSSGSSQGLMVALEPGARWTFGARRLSGPWVGLAVPLSVSSSQATFQNTDGAIAFSATGLSASADALVGWSHRFENGLLVQLAAGPRASLLRTTGSSGEQRSVSAGVRGFMSVGATF